MPPPGPKLGLALAVEVPPDDDDCKPSLRDSWEVGANGSVTVLTKSITPYQFSSSGLTKAKGPGQDLHYRVSESDIVIIKPLGSGCSSVVLKAFLHTESKFVALKKINILQKETRGQMLNDVKALCDVPNAQGVIRFHGAYHSPGSGQICLVLEHMDGGSLADVLRRVGRVPERVLSAITLRVLQGLALLHRRKMVHRDIKPANILMSQAGDAKISDFGISAFVDATLADCQTFTGTVTYMSPERIESRPYSFPADIWSLGLVLAECASGRYPYDASGGPLELMIQVVQEDPPLPPLGEISPQLRDFISCCLARDPTQRPSAEALLHHPFVAGPGAGCAADVKAFMQCMWDPLEKLDEIAFVFSWQYYDHRSRGADGVAQLANLYLDTSVLQHQGESCTGRAAILARLRSAAQLHAGFGPASWRARQVDCQPLGCDGSALVHVLGTVSLGSGSSGGGGGAAGGSGGGSAAGFGAAGRSSFAEVFVLSQNSPGEYYVANQVFRLLS